MAKLVTIFFVLLIVVPINNGAIGQSASVDSLLFKRGIDAFEKAQYDEAIELFEKVLWRDSLQAAAHAMLARTHDILGKNIQASHQARLALKDDPDNLEYLQLRYEIGFIGPRPLNRARERAILDKMLDVDPENAFAHGEIGAEKALIYLHHRDRIRIPDYLPQASPFENGSIATQGNIPTDIPSLVTDPFDLQEMRSQGFTIIDAGQPAEKAYSQAINHLARSVQSDPQYRLSYDRLLAVYAAAERHPEMLRWTRTMRSFMPDDPFSHLYSGYVAYKMGRMDEADQHFEDALQRLSPTDAQVFADYTRISKQKRGDQVSVDALDEYWEGKDPRYLSPYNERQLEHFARLVYAYLLFGESKLDMQGWDSERGDIYVRYGHPKSMYYLTIAVEDCDIGGSSLTSDVGENNITNFHVFQYEDYRFVFGLSGNFAVDGDPTNFTNVRVPPFNEFVLYSTCSSAMGSSWAQGANLDYVTSTRALKRQVPDAFSLQGNVVDFPYLATIFKGESEQPEVLVSYAYPVSLSNEQKSSENRSRPFALGLETGVFLINNEGEIKESRRDSVSDVYLDELLEFDETTLWSGTHLLEVPAGEYTISVEFEREADGAIGAQQALLTIPEFRLGDLAMSDLLLGYFVEDALEDSGEAPGIIRRNGLDIRVAPWGIYELGQSVYFYFETYNLSQDAGQQSQYTVEALLVDADEGRKGLGRLFRRARRNRDNSVSVRFDGVSDTPDMGQYLIMDTAGKPVGNYMLVVRITDTETGTQVEKQRNIFLR